MARRALPAVLVAVTLTASACVGPDAVVVPIEYEGEGSTVGGEVGGAEERSAGAEAEPGDLSGDPLGGFTPAPLHWETCPRTTTKKCADLTVPLDWSRPDGETIDVAVAMAPATGDRIGSLVLNPGGPGAEGKVMAFHPPVSDAVEERFDIIGFDPRGVGESGALVCGTDVERFWNEDSSPDDDAEQQRLDTAAQAIAQECAMTDGDLIAHMGTDSVARDVEALRRAMGDEPLNYLGFSYGTLIGLRYLDLFGSEVRTMVLDGVVDPAEPLTEWLAGQARGLDDGVDSIFGVCDASSRCPLEDAAASYDELAARVEEAPMSGGRAPGPTELGPSELATAAVMATYSPQLRTPLLEGIAAAIDGDPDPLLTLTGRYYAFGGFTSYVSVVCSDSERPRGSEAWQAFADELEGISPRFGASVANELLPCAFWSVDPSPVTGEVRAGDAPDVLVLGNRGDAATPYSNSVAVADALASGHLVSYDGTGHTSYGESSCVDDTVDRYLIDIVVPDADPDC